MFHKPRQLFFHYNSYWPLNIDKLFLLQPPLNNFMLHGWPNMVRTTCSAIGQPSIGLSFFGQQSFRMVHTLCPMFLNDPIRTTPYMVRYAQP